MEFWTLRVASAAIIATLACGLTFTAANAGIITSSPTLPPLAAAFTTNSTGSCFPTAGVCANPGTLTFNSVVPSPPASPSFNASGQDILLNATLTGVLTDPSHVPFAPLLLTGTIEMEILGRTFSTETGSWTVELLAADLEGPVSGHTLTLGLDASSTSTGTISVVPVGNQFQIDSFLDIFADLTLDGPTPLHTTREASFELASPATAIPEPASIAAFASALLGLGFLIGCKRKAS